MFFRTIIIFYFADDIFDFRFDWFRCMRGNIGRVIRIEMIERVACRVSAPIVPKSFELRVVDRCRVKPRRYTELCITRLKRTGK
jgi:hypothetical protein